MNDMLRQDHPLVLATVLKALNDPTRLRIIQELINDEIGAERHCTSFSGLSEVARATRSHHFKVLREAGLVSLVDRGNLLLARLRWDEIEKAYPGLLNILARG